jgi:secreted trypsin-like serine protease
VSKILSSCATALAAAAFVVAPGLAITGGSVDGAAHPSVGLIATDGSDGTRTPLCSGVLVAPTVVVTAAHCFAADGERVSVTFDATADPARSSFTAGRAVVDPAYGSDKRDPHDLAVVLLAAPVSPTPARLPSAGEVARSAPGDVVNVGYGYQSAKDAVYDGVRRWSTSQVAKVDAATISLKLRDGGVCFGDSGGPHFSGTTVAAIVSTGNRACSGQSTGYRLDTAAARQFLGRFVPLP